MEVDAANLNRSIGQEEASDYWREKAECLEEWVCELLRSNQALRMDMQRVTPIHLQHEESTIAFSVSRRGRSSFSLAQPAYGEMAELHSVKAIAHSPRKECAEVRRSILRYAIMNGVDSEASN
jgi:hypothetical protein